MTPQQIQERVSATVLNGVALYGSAHQLTHAIEELVELTLALTRLQCAIQADAGQGRIDMLTHDATQEAADVILAMGTVRFLLGPSVDAMVVQKLERYEKCLRACKFGRDECARDARQELHFASVGGITHRFNFSAPKEFRKLFPDDSGGKIVSAFFDGYRLAAREIYGPEWRTCDLVIRFNVEDRPPVCGDPYPHGEGICLKDKDHDDVHGDQGPEGPRFW